MLAYPFAFEGKLIQYIGRVQRSETAPIIYDYRDVYIDYLGKLFRQRNRYYQKLLHNGQLQKHDELVLIFNEDKVYINSEANILSISCLDLPIEAEKFREDVAWKVRVLNYDETTGVLMTEIINYDANTTLIAGTQASLQFMDIEAIKFRTIDTPRLLKAIEVKKLLVTTFEEPAFIYTPPKAFIDDEASDDDKESDDDEEFYNDEELNNDEESQAVNAIPLKHENPVIPKPVERVLVKTMKVPFDHLQFQNAHVSFSIYIDELQQQVKFTIENPDIRAEFEAIKAYFIK